MTHYRRNWSGLNEEIIPGFDKVAYPLFEKDILGLEPFSLEAWLDMEM